MSSFGILILFISNCYFAASLCPFPCPKILEPATDTLLETILTNVLYNVLNGASCSCPNPMDPLTIETISATFANLEYTGSNNVYTGLSNTSITSLRVSEDNKIVAMKLDIPSISTYGNTDFTGYILYLPSNGSGPYEVDFGRFLLNVYVQLLEAPGNNGCPVYQFGNFTLDAKSLSTTEFSVANITDNGQDVTIQRNCFLNQYYQDALYFVRDPIFTQIIQKLLSYANNYLMYIPVYILTG